MNRASRQQLINGHPTARSQSESEAIGGMPQVLAEVFADFDLPCLVHYPLLISIYLLCALIELSHRRVLDQWELEGDCALLKESQQSQFPYLSARTGSAVSRISISKSRREGRVRSGTRLGKL